MPRSVVFTPRGVTPSATPRSLDPTRTVDPLSRGLAFVDDPIPTPASMPDPGPPVARDVVDATVVNQTLYTLTEQGQVESVALTKDAPRCPMPVSAPPEPIKSIHTIGKKLVALGKNSGTVYTFTPCGGGPREWVAQRLTRSTATAKTVALAVEQGNITHLSISPDGKRVWAQNATFGQFFAPTQDDTWTPVGTPTRLGNPDVRRVIGDVPNEHVDLLKGRAVRLGKVENVPYVVYAGSGAVRSRGVGAEDYHPTLPNVVDSDRTRRVAPGVVVTFPCSLDTVSALCASRS